MKCIARPLLVAVSLAFASPTFSAEAERAAHFQGKPARTLDEAYENLSSYNKKLTTLLKGELTLQAMAEIHQITYTLENALHKIDSEVEDLAETLEELHLASERGNAAVTLKEGKAYLGLAEKVSSD